MSLSSLPEAGSKPNRTPHCSRASFTFHLRVTHAQKVGGELCGIRLTFGRVRQYLCRHGSAAQNRLPRQANWGLCPGSQIGHLGCQGRLR